MKISSTSPVPLVVSAIIGLTMSGAVIANDGEYTNEQYNSERILSQGALRGARIVVPSEGLTSNIEGKSSESSVMNRRQMQTDTSSTTIFYSNPVNILWSQQSGSAYSALAVNNDGNYGDGPCGSLYSETSIEFARVTSYVVEVGFVTQNLTEPQYQWIFHDDGMIESVQCPGKVLDVAANNCDRGEVVLYGAKTTSDTDNQRWNIVDVPVQLLDSVQLLDDDDAINLDRIALTSVKCPDRYITTAAASSAEYPVSLLEGENLDFKNSAFAIQT